MITEMYPDFPDSYYYLGYAYLNLGLYVKAQFAWEKFMEYSKDGKNRKEIRERLQQLEEPVQIEQGCNDVMSGRYQQGIALLEKYKTSRFKTWWPLFYYLGIGYEMTGQMEEAIASFKKVLTMNASHIETMEELVAIYEKAGDEANVFKYANKIRIIKAALAEDQRALMEETLAEDKKLQENEPEM
jgi:tetratricopeptide (TPR) repeat protein